MNFILLVFLRKIPRVNKRILFLGLEYTNCYSQWQQHIYLPLECDLFSNSFYLQQNRRNIGYLRNEVLLLKNKEVRLEAKNSKNLVLCGLASFDRRIIIRHCVHSQKRRHRSLKA